MRFEERTVEDEFVLSQNGFDLSCNRNGSGRRSMQSALAIDAQQQHESPFVDQPEREHASASDRHGANHLCADDVESDVGCGR
jgi:hypothetical protein